MKKYYYEQSLIDDDNKEFFVEFEIEFYEKPHQLVLLVDSSKIYYSHQLGKLSAEELLENFEDFLDRYIVNAIELQIERDDKNYKLTAMHPWDQLTLIYFFNLQDANKTCINSKDANVFQNRLQEVSEIILNLYKQCPGIKPRAFYTPNSASVLFRITGIHHVSLESKEKSKKKYAKPVVHKNFCKHQRTIYPFISAVWKEIFKLISGQISPSIRIAYDENHFISSASTYIEGLEIHPRLSSELILDINFIRGLTGLRLIRERDLHINNLAIIRLSDQSIRLVYYDVDSAGEQLKDLDVRMQKDRREELELTVEDLQWLPRSSNYIPNNGIHQQLEESRLLQLSSNLACIKAKYKTILMFCFMPKIFIEHLCEKYIPFPELRTQVLRYLIKETGRIELLLLDDMLCMKIMSMYGAEIIQEIINEYQQYNSEIEIDIKTLLAYSSCSESTYKKYCAKLKTLQTYLTEQLNIDVKLIENSELFPFEHLEIDNYTLYNPLLKILEEHKIIKVKFDEKNNKYYIYYIELDFQSLENFISSYKNHYLNKCVNMFPFVESVTKVIDNIVLKFANRVSENPNILSYLDYLKYIGVIHKYSIENNKAIISKYNHAYLFSLENNPEIYLKRILTWYFFDKEIELIVKILNNGDIEINCNDCYLCFDDLKKKNIIQKYLSDRISSENRTYTLKGVNYKLFVEFLTNEILANVNYSLCKNNSHKNKLILADIFSENSSGLKKYRKYIRGIREFDWGDIFEIRQDLSQDMDLVIEGFQNIFNQRNIKISHISIDTFQLEFNKEESKTDVLSFLQWLVELGWCQYDVNSCQLKIINIPIFLDYFNNYKVPMELLQRCYSDLAIEEYDHPKLFVFFQKLMKEKIIPDVKIYLKANLFDENDLREIALAYTAQFGYAIFISNEKDSDLIEYIFLTNKRHEFSGGLFLPLVTSEDIVNVQYAKRSGLVIGTFDFLHQNNYLQMVYQFYANALANYVESKTNVVCQFDVNQEHKIIIENNDSFNDKVLSELTSLQEKNIVLLSSDSNKIKVTIIDFYHIYIQQRNEIIDMLSELFAPFVNINKKINTDKLPINIKISRKNNEGLDNLIQSLSNMGVFYCENFIDYYVISRVDYSALKNLMKTGDFFAITTEPSQLNRFN